MLTEDAGLKPIRSVRITPFGQRAKPENISSVAPIQPGRARRDYRSLIAAVEKISAVAALRPDGATEMALDGVTVNLPRLRIQGNRRCLEQPRLRRCTRRIGQRLPKQAEET